MSDPLAQVHGAAVRALTAPGAPFEIVARQTGRGPVRTYLHAEPDLDAFFAAAEAAHADMPFLIYEERSWSYREVFAAGRRLAGSLEARYGVGPGARVGIATRNRVEWFIAFLAAVRLGAIAVLFNSRSAAPELAAAADRTGCTVIIADEARAALFADAAGSPPLIVIPQTEQQGVETLAALSREGLAEAQAAALDPDAPALILFTSGTTGRPKGAVLTHRNLCNMAHNLRFSGAVGIALAADRLGVDVLSLRARTPAPSTLLVFPLFHISGLTNFIMTALAGGKLVLLRRWDPTIALSLVEQHGVTALSGPTLVMSDLLDQPDAARRLASLSSFVVGGQATPRSLIERVTRALPRAGQATGWGMTESSGSVSSAAGPVLLARPGSCGRLSPVTEARVVGADGRVLGAGDVGELQLRGALVMQAYWDEPEATEKAFQDGWLKTGDLGYIDAEGYVYLVDRAKDMVISAGENIYCAEVERVLCACPDFTEAALFGVPDVRLGERAVAAVALKPGVSLGPDAVKAMVRAELADYKTPAEVVFDLAPLPRNALGKIDKRALRTAYLERQREPA